MKKFLLLSDKVKRYSVIGMIAIASLMTSCSDNETPSPITPEDKEQTTKDVIRLDITDVKKLAHLNSITNEPQKKFQFRVINNLPVDANTVGELKYFGDWKKKDNISVEWSKNSKGTRSGDTYVVTPNGQVPLTYEQYSEDFGGVPIAAAEENSDTNSFVTTDADAEKFFESGIEAVTGYKGENIVIENPDQLADWVDIVSEYAGRETRSKTGTRASVTLGQSLNSNVKGLRIKNEHIKNLQTITELADIENKNLQADEKDVVTNADLLKQYTLHGDGSKYNGGKLFKVIGANGAENLMGKTNGQFIKTDTVSIGINGAKLKHFVPNQAFVDVHGADVSVLSDLSDWTNDAIEIVPIADKSLPGGQRALMGHTDETLNMISTPAARVAKGPYTYNINPILTRYVKKNAVTRSGTEHEGAMSITVLNDSTGYMSYQKVMASNHLAGEEYQALVNADELAYSCKHDNRIWWRTLKDRIDEFNTTMYRYNQDDNYIYFTGNNVTIMYNKDEFKDGIELIEAVFKWGMVAKYITASQTNMFPKDTEFYGRSR